MTFCPSQFVKGEKGWAGCAASVFQLMGNLPWWETSHWWPPSTLPADSAAAKRTRVTGQCQPIGVGLVLATVQAGSRVKLIQVVNLMINWFKHFYW